MVLENVLVCDIETKVVGARPDPNKDILKFVGFRNNAGETVMFHADDRDKIQYGLTGKTRFIVGHNFKEYDAVVLKRHGFKIYPSVIIDTLDILRKRAAPMMYLDLNQGQMGLGYLAHYFGLSTMKGEIDYDIFKQEDFTRDELEEIKTYLDGDLDTTWDLFEYLYNFFIGFRDFVSEQDKTRMVWLTASPGGVAYKAVCNMAGIEEEYDDVDEEDDGIQYQGAFVALPEVEFADGDIYCADFSSLYPHMFMGGNLYSPIDDDLIGVADCWHGSGVFESVEDNEEDGIVGYYSRTRGKIEQTIKDLYNLRVSIRAEMKDMTPDSQEWKTADARQLATKIIINTIYGISGSRIFKNVFSLTTAADCTSMARMAIKDARQKLTEAGFECLYTDTDSVYFRDPNKDYEEVERVCKAITDEQRASFNIDIESHDFEIEAKIKRMYFFRNDDGEFVKKLYLYEKDNGKITLKGIPLVRGTTSDLAKEIYKKYIEPTIHNGEPVMMSREVVANHVRELISVDNVKKRFRVGDIDDYKSKSSIQAQIAMMYGAGEHWLIPNLRVGAGKDVKYAPIEELDAIGDPMELIDIRKYMGELKHFIPYEERKMIKLMGQKHICKSFTVKEEHSPLQQLVACRSCNKGYMRFKMKKSSPWKYFAESSRQGDIV